MDNQDKQKENNIYNIIISVLAIIAVVGLCYLGYLMYDNYQNTIIDYEKQIDNLHSTINQKTQSINNYKTKVDSMNKQIQFMNDHVAICPLDGSGLYHRYGCEHLDTSSFMIYNTEQAPNEEYSPCPYCFTETTNTSNDITEIVYITNTGSKYHREGCSYLKSKKSITTEKAQEQGYIACERCNP